MNIKFYFIYYIYYLVKTKTKKINFNKPKLFYIKSALLIYTSNLIFFSLNVISTQRFTK